jgi:hypothetical protein
VSSGLVYHYVVTGEIDDNGDVKFYIDDATAVARFGDGVVWDSVEESWHPVTDGAEDGRIGQALSTALGLGAPEDLTTEPRFG